MGSVEGGWDGVEGGWDGGTNGITVCCTLPWVVTVDMSYPRAGSVSVVSR